MSERPLSEEDKGTLKLARAFEPMLRSEGWHFFRQIVESRLKEHTNAVMSATVDLGGIFAGERDKGAVVALRMVLNLASTVIEEAQEIRKKRGEDPDATD